MAARTRRTTLNEKWREKIRTSMILNRVDNHALGEVEMTPSQLDAAKFLLNKVISNAPNQNEHSGIDGGAIPISINVKLG